MKKVINILLGANNVYNWSQWYVFGKFEAKDEAVKVANILNNMHILIDRHDIKNKSSYFFEVKDVDDTNELPFFDFSIFLS